MPGGPLGGIPGGIMPGMPGGIMPGIPGGIMPRQAFRGRKKGGIRKRHGKIYGVRGDGSGRQKNND